jgi:hypothetical protein
MTKLAEILAARPPGDASTPLVTLESGAVISLDRSAHWIHTSSEGLMTQFTAATGHVFAEVVEQPRDTFDDALAASARAAELPSDEVVFAFPALDVVRAVLAKNYAYLTRLALLWIRPSELREMRAEIILVTETPNIPGPVKDLARRLTVAEGSG